MNTTRPPRLTWVALGLGGSAFTFLFAYRFVLHHFVTGPVLWDTGWLSYASFQNGFLLPNPPYFRPILGESIFTQHVYGLVSLASPLSHLFSTHYQYFATVVGVFHALTFVGPFLLVMSAREASGRTWVHAVSATLAGLVFAFSGPAVSALGYPHFEIAIPAFFIIFLALHFLGLRRVVWMPLVLGLLVREDAGLHYLTYFGIIAAYQWRADRRPIATRTLAAAAAVSALVTVMMLVFQRHFFPLGQSMFEKSFVGSPAFAHVTFAGSWTRLHAFLASAQALYVPAAVIALAALLFRKVFYILAYVACLPWIVINVFFSLTPAAQTLSLYYGFPLLVGLAWPLASVHWDQARARSFAVPVFFAACALSAAVLPFHSSVLADSRAGGYLPPSLYLRQRACLESEFRANPRLFADTSVVAMFPHSVPSKRVLNTAGDIAGVEADGLVFFEDSKASAYYDRAQGLGLHRSAVLKIPPLRLLSRAESGFATCVGK